MQQTQQNEAWKNELPVFSSEELDRYRKHRKRVMTRLLDAGVGKCSQGTKLFSGRLSPGCDHCRFGTWSCLYINGLCSASCAFCPQDRGMTVERPPVASVMVFEKPDVYLDFLKKFGYGGVGISGGEPFLVFDKVIAFITAVRKHLGGGTYIWLYTNGKHITKTRLERLKEAGLNEIRLNLTVHDYRTDILPLVRKLMPTVAVEIPALPGDYAKLENMVDRLSAIGVDHLNLHQLHATKANHHRLPHGLHFFPTRRKTVPNAESDLAALRVLEYVLHNRLDLSVNYCCQKYKNFFQSRTTRTRAAHVVCEPHETISDAGYIKRILIREADIRKCLSVLGPLKTTPCAWHHDEEKRELSIRTDLVPHLKHLNVGFTVQYEIAFIDCDKGEFFTPECVEEISVKRRFEYETPVLRDFQRLDRGDLPAATARFERVFQPPGSVLFG